MAQSPMMTKATRWPAAALLVAGVLAVLPGQSGAAPDPGAKEQTKKVEQAVGADTSAPLRDLAKVARPGKVRVPDERGAIPADKGFTGDGAVQKSGGVSTQIAAPIVNFEGAANVQNPFLLSPPDPDGDVGPNHYVQLLNVMLAIYDKAGNTLLGPVTLGSIWDGFEVPDCADSSGDPIVLHDQLANRWLLTQFTTAGPTFYNCFAVSATADPTGAYHRYAFSTDVNFPDYPKYGVWPNAYFGSSREFTPDNQEGAGVYAFERRKMLAGDPTARQVRFFVPQGDRPWLVGNGLLPSDLDGRRLPPEGSPNYFVGTMDDGGGLGAPFDGINVFQFWVSWGITPVAQFLHTASIPVAPFDSIFPCNPPPDTRDCIPQPGTTNKLDILSYRQRPMWRLAYRNHGTHEALVTNQSVEAAPAISGVRWYELRRPGDQPFVYQQGTYAPADGTHRWMASTAQDKRGNQAVGYSVSSDSVFPGIRYTGRLANDPIGQMTQGEGILINGSGSQTGNPPGFTSRWGDYTSMHVDPTDDCTFWYTNEYYAVTSERNWQTRIGAFRLPGCR